MPHIALTTGNCDSMGCMLPKIGVAASEIGVESSGTSKAINVYSDGTETLPGATTNDTLYKSLSLLSTYDIGIFSCNCQESYGGSTTPKYGDPEFTAVTDYLDNGGRIFTTDFQYIWYRYSPDPALWVSGQPASNANATGIGTVVGGAPFPWVTTLRRPMRRPTSRRSTSTPGSRRGPPSPRG